MGNPNMLRPTNKMKKKLIESLIVFSNKKMKKENYSIKRHQSKIFNIIVLLVIAAMTLRFDMSMKS